MTGYSLNHRSGTLQVGNASVRGNGYTLLELLVVLAIVSILAVLALPAYFDYAKRTQVTEGMAAASSLRQAIGDYFSTNEAFPSSNADMGITPTNYATQWVQRLDVESSNPGTHADIIVTLDVPDLEGETIILRMSYNGAGFVFNCKLGTLDNIYRPPECRI
ncbi:MAG: pilin [bacterium]